MKIIDERDTQKQKKNKQNKKRQKRTGGGGGDRNYSKRVRTELLSCV